MLVFCTNFYLKRVLCIINKTFYFILVCIDANEDANMKTKNQQIGFEVKVEPEVCSNDTNENESKIFCVKRKVFIIGLQKCKWYVSSFISYFVLPMKNIFFLISKLSIEL